MTDAKEDAAQDVVQRGVAAPRSGVVESGFGVGLAAYVPERAGIYVRISDDPLGLERGVSRQTEDCHDRAGVLGWGVGGVYTENDTSAYRKRKVLLPDGRVGLRVVRPQWARMIEDLYHGRIDGIIVWDQDRLLRQPRDLEDLIDIVEMVQRPVVGITTTINLLTSDGRAMARVMAAMALKSSEDTARRVVRAKLQDAAEGKVRAIRRFGRQADGTVIETEAQALKDAAALVLKTQSWYQGTTLLQAGPTRPVGGGRWHASTLRNILLSPSVAGLAMYRGKMRKGTVGHVNAADPTGDALRDAAGDYIGNGLDPIIDVATWEALCALTQASHAKQARDVPTTRKYLLTGILRCMCEHPDGTVCGRSVAGTWVKRPNKPEGGHVIYRCPGKGFGGCGRIQRVAQPIDDLIEQLLFEHLRRHAPRRPAGPKLAGPVKPSGNARTLSVLRERLADMNTRYATGDESLSEQTYYAALPTMEAEIKRLAALVEAEQPDQAPRLTAEQVAQEWAEAGTVAGRRAILARYLHAIEIRPSSNPGNHRFDPATITPIWKELPTR